MLLDTNNNTLELQLALAYALGRYSDVASASKTPKSLMPLNLALSANLGAILENMSICGRALGSEACVDVITVMDSTGKTLHVVDGHTTSIKSVLSKLERSPVIPNFIIVLDNGHTGRIARIVGDHLGNVVRYCLSL